MVFASGVVWKVHLRLRDLAARPRLFNDRMPPRRVHARIERFRRWCGPILWAVLCDYEHRRMQPRNYRCARHWPKDLP
jgi:hypothetical protein